MSDLAAEVVIGACLVLGCLLGSVLVRLRLRVRERELRVAELERLARTDDLTGLPNRRMWEEQLPRELARAIRSREQLCVAMIDVDLFKQYNDQHGHLAGDRLLKQTASTWRALLRPFDLLARYGGDEFGLILPGCDLPEASSIVDRVCAATPNGQSSSAGVAEWDREDHAEVLVARADAALYEAKRAGRAQAVCSAPADSAH